MARIEMLRVENERLREALEKIDTLTSHTNFNSISLAVNRITQEVLQSPGVHPESEPNDKT